MPTYRQSPIYKFLYADTVTELGTLNAGQLRPGDFCFVNDVKRYYYWDGSSWIIVDTGIDSFTGLSDTPSSYSGQAGKVIAVKPDETGLEFINVASGSYVSKDGDIINTLNGYTWNVDSWFLSTGSTYDISSGSDLNLNAVGVVNISGVNIEATANNTSYVLNIDNTGTGADLKVGIIRASGTKPNMIFGDAWLEFWHPTLNSVLWNIRNDGQARFFAGAAYSGQLEIYTGMTVWNQATIRGDPGATAPQIRFNNNAIHVEFNKATDEFLITMVPSQSANPLIIEDDVGTAKFEINPQGQIETYTPKTYIYAYDTTQQVVATANTWQDVTFDTVEISDGDITHPNATDFVFNVSGTFVISYSPTFFRSGTPTGARVATRIVLNGTEIQGSYITRRMPGNGVDFTDAKTIIIQANVGDVLKIQLNGTATNVGIDPNTDFANLPASITLSITRVI